MRMRMRYGVDAKREILFNPIPVGPPELHERSGLCHVAQHLFVGCSGVEEANRAAAKRRAWAKREGGRLEEERRAHWRAHVQGRGVMPGEFVYTV